jgi:hypothetical protein
MKCRGPLVASLLCSFVFTAPAHASQTVGSTTGSINGTVTDSTGAVLPGVTIAISGDVQMGERSGVTDREGRYRFVALQPGAYQLVLTLPGFKSVTRSGIQVDLRFTATVDIEMEIASLEEKVIVKSGAPVLDTQSTERETRFGARELRDLPGARSMWTILAVTPAVQVGRFDVGGSATVTGIPFSVYGTTSPNRPHVEGISIAGISGTGFTLDYGSFEEVSVGTAAHDAEWSIPGLQMQFIVKSGGNRYNGTLYADYENQQWQSFNIDESQIGRGAQGGGGLSPRESNRLWSYHDLNADVGGYLRRDVLWWYGSFRNQDVAARVVNFKDAPFQTRLTNYSGKGTYRLTPNNKAVVFALAGRNFQPNHLDAFGPAGGSLTPTTAIIDSVEATTDQHGWGRIWKAEWDSSFNDRLFVEARIGQFAVDRHETPHSTKPRFEDVNTLAVRGGNRDFVQDLLRDQAFVSVSYFKDGWLGNHQFKGGGDLLRTKATEDWIRGYSGDVLHVLNNGAPTEVYLFQTPSVSESGLWTSAAYAKDSWRLNARLTVNLGLRLDHYQLFLPEQTHPAGTFNATLQTFPAVDNLIDWSQLAPRIGVIHDLSGNSKTLVKVTYGKYWLPPGTELGFNGNPNSNQWWRRYRWFDLNHSGAWDTGEEGQLLGSRGGSTLESLDPGLRLPFMKEVTASIERETRGRIGLRVGFVWRSEQQHYLRTNANQAFDAFAVPVMLVDPGPDGLSGNSDDGAEIQAYNLLQQQDSTPMNVVRNIPDSDSHYWTWEFEATKRFGGRWSLRSGFSSTRSGDQANAYFGQVVRNNMYPLTPNDLINAGEDGRYALTTWSAKISGTYEGRWGVRVSPLVRHQSGQPFGRVFLTRALNYGNVRILAEPLGTSRMDNVTLVDVRVEKTFRLGSGRVAGFVDVFNLLNANPEQNVSWLSGPTFLQPLNIVPPRIARIGARLEW